MNTIYALSLPELLFGLACFIWICWKCWQAGMLERGADTPQDHADDDAAIERIKEVSKPMELERPHVRAGSTWNGDIK
jgi:hypothetical protein